MEKYDNLIAYDKACRAIYRAEAELKNTDAAKACASLHKKLSELMKMKEQDAAKVRALSGEISKYSEIYDKYKRSYLIEKEDFDDREGSDDISSAEYQECRRELEKLKNDIKRVMKNLLDIAQQAEHYAKEIGEINAKGSQGKKKYDAAMAKRQSERDEKKEEFEALQAKKKETAKAVERQLLEQYEKIATSHIDPLAYILNGTMCGGCSMTLPSSTVSRIDAEGMIICENCGRMLFKS